MDSYRDERTSFTSYTKEDNRRLQVIQNLNRCGTLSVHQLGAPRTLVMLKKILSSQRPGYVAEKLESRPSTASRSGETITQPQTALIIRRSGFLYRGAKLCNLLLETLRREEKISCFKKGLRNWIKKNIPVKP